MAATATTFQRALAHHAAGRAAESEQLCRDVLRATPDHPDALHLLGVIALQGGHVDAAADLIGRSVSIAPSEHACCNLGNALRRQGRLAEAIRSFRQALSLNADSTDALCNLGNALFEAGDVDGAIAPCRRAIALRPDFAEAHCNLGNALLARGQADEAIDCYRRTLALQPAWAVVHGNLGDALRATGRPEDALDSYRQAASLQPGAAEWRVRMGWAFKQAGRWDAAIQCHVDALACSDRPDIRLAFVQSIATAHFLGPEPRVRDLVIRALEEVWVDPAELLTPATSLVEAAPAVRAALERVDTRIEPALVEAIAGDRLLMVLLRSDAINSIALERLLVRLRRQLLDDAVSNAAPHGPATTLLHAAIAGQCFINEYVYACSDDEHARVETLRGRLADAAATGALPDARSLTAFASYAPLSDLRGFADVVAWIDRPWPQPMVDLFKQQVVEPDVERRLRADIPRITPIDDRVSRLVQAQYEANPYPRWLHAPPSVVPTDIDTLMRRRLPHAPYRPLGRSGRIDVLVAGCGTGQHPIQVARQLTNATILAVDLSLASLGYASRKTAEIGQGGISSDSPLDITYAQADILQLGTIERRFDVIESAGVLHHLADPEAGWRVLVDRLRPGGLMGLALYSEAGRRDVVAARALLEGQPLPETTDDIRRCRQRLMADDMAPRFRQFLSSRDFYSTSACRDLLFHVQEHRFTLPRIAEIVGRFGLRFLGFVLDAEVRAAYARQFPDDPAQTDLAHWHAFETARPDTFSRMYQFWLQKPPM